MTRTAASDKVRRRSAARKTITEAERRKRAARTMSERELLDSIIDRAKRSLAAVEKELQEEWRAAGKMKGDLR